jgi:hypothetical protein
MLNVTELAFSCCPVTDLERARECCEGVRRLKLTPVSRMAVIFDTDGNTICLQKRNPGR